MLSVGEALDEIVRVVQVLGAERVGLFAAVSRVLAEDVRSLRDVPGFANSAMDGFAVRHVDLAMLPARLHITGVTAAGATSLATVRVGEAVKIMTGAPVPLGADTVVRVEDTREEGGDVVVDLAPANGSNIRLPGEDVQSGDIVLERGKRLTPADIGLASSVGKALLLVHRRPRVAILSTGNELVEADEPVALGQIVNSNAYALSAAVTEAGGVPVPLAIARDTREDIRAAFLEAARADAILSTGGVSVGELDYVKGVMDEIGVERVFWKVAQKPGKPLTFGTLDGRPYFGLPGNPVSSLVCFYLYVRPALRRMMGLDALHLPTAEARLGQDLKKSKGMTEFIRCRLETENGSLIATSTGSQSSAVLHSMSRGQALIVAPADEVMLRAGSMVRVILIDGDHAAKAPPF